MKYNHSITAILFFCLALISCNRQKDIFTLEGVIESGCDDSIIVVGFDYRFDRTDTIRPVNGEFKYRVQVDTITPLILLHTDGTQDIVFAEKELVSSLYKSDSTYYSTITGGSANDELTLFRSEVMNDTTLAQIVARIDTFVTENPFSEVIPYLIYEYMIHRNSATVSQINSITKKMSGLLQDHQFMLDLNSNTKNIGGTASFISRVTVSDTANIKSQFNQICDLGHQVICIWASWNEQSRNARKQIYALQDSFPKKQIMQSAISIDTNFDRWKESVDADSLNWTEYCDPMGWNSKIITTAGITRLPAYLLLTAQEYITAVCYSIDDLKYTINDRVPNKDDD